MVKVVETRKNKGFTLVELIIVIAILAIIMLIATLAYGGIQQRMKVRSDKATCSEIGKALAVREADLDKSKGIQLYPEVVEYDTLEGIEDYIKPGLTPQSMPDGGYIVTAIQTDTGKKILVGIGKNDQEISTDLYVDNEGAGWAWTEGKEISKFIEENNSKFTPVKTLAGITGGESAGGGSNIVAIMENSAVTVGSYIDYTGGDYTGKWVVLRNNGGTIEIISKESVGSQTLSVASDYANVVQILNDKCATYVNSTYATSGRSVGATSSSIGQINTTNNPLTFEAARTQELPYHDEYYTADQTIIANNMNLWHISSGEVWLASRYLDLASSYSYFYVRTMDPTGWPNIKFLTVAYSGGSTSPNSYSYGVRPVITLKSGIKITGGDGSSDDPYTIGL